MQLLKSIVAIIVCVDTVIGMPIRDKSRFFKPDHYQTCIDSQLLPQVSVDTWLVGPFVEVHGV